MGLRESLQKHLDALGMAYEHDGIAWTYIQPLPEDQLTQAQRDLRNLLTAPADQVCHTTRIVDFVGTPAAVLHQFAFSYALSEDMFSSRTIHVGSRHGAIRVAERVAAPDLPSQLRMAELHMHSVAVDGSKKMLGAWTSLSPGWSRSRLFDPADLIAGVRTDGQWWAKVALPFGVDAHPGLPKVPSAPNGCHGRAANADEARALVDHILGEHYTLTGGAYVVPTPPPRHPDAFTARELVQAIHAAVDAQNATQGCPARTEPVAVEVDGDVAFMPREVGKGLFDASVSCANEGCWEVWNRTAKTYTWSGVGLAGCVEACLITLRELGTVGGVSGMTPLEIKARALRVGVPDDQEVPLVVADSSIYHGRYALDAKLYLTQVGRLGAYWPATAPDGGPEQTAKSLYILTHGVVEQP